MNYVIIAMQVIVGLSILNVWLVQNKKPTKWRGGKAKTIFEEFKAYGLPIWSCYVIGDLKVILAILLIASIWYPVIKEPAALGLALLLLGSIAMHFKIKDPLYKSFPAFLFFLMCTLIAASSHIQLIF
ncbi:DoxX family protein [Aquimarina sp. MMG016]|uniref:DoxX family protein n=1 Tax=Aquimarina sp. MMG016 TaxID=2822690 RepID=UPI001B3A118E|nr:DoxX family protein [Aquimarina sp. MMG016]MBQ4820534.1 DoxX family protein [Aquimarina sp. MMG016]